MTLAIPTPSDVRKGLRATETNVVVRVRWMVPVTIGDPHVVIVVVPRTATQHAENRPATSCASRRKLPKSITSFLASTMTLKDAERLFAKTVVRVIDMCQRVVRVPTSFALTDERLSRESCLPQNPLAVVANAVLRV